MALAEYNRVGKDLSPQQERVADLLAAGCSPAQVSGATGYSLSYISELGKLVGFKEVLVKKASKRVERDVKLQDGYDSVEGMLLIGIKERAATADMSELSRALDVVAKNNPKKGKFGGSAEGSNSGGAVSVTINLPAHVLQPLNIQTNSRNEVIEVGGRAMEPLTAAAIQSRLNALQ